MAWGLPGFALKINWWLVYSNPKSFVNFLLPSERVRGGLGWGKKFTTPARIAIDPLLSLLVENFPEQLIGRAFALRLQNY